MRGATLLSYAKQSWEKRRRTDGYIGILSIGRRLRTEYLGHA